MLQAVGVSVWFVWFSVRFPAQSLSVALRALFSTVVCVRARAGVCLRVCASWAICLVPNYLAETPMRVVRKIMNCAGPET